MLCLLSYASVAEGAGLEPASDLAATAGFQPAALPIRHTLPWRRRRDLNPHGAVNPSPVFETGGLPISFYVSSVVADRKLTGQQGETRTPVGRS